MTGLLKGLAHGFMSAVRFDAKPLPEPEPINAKARPITGFLAHLTPDQRARALAHRGDENTGERRFLRTGG